MNISYQEQYLHEHGFSEHFKKSIAPILIKIEKRRKAAMVCYGLALVISYSLLGWLAHYDITNGSALRIDIEMVLSILGLCLLAYAPAALVRYFFEKKNKSLLFPNIINFFPLLNYSAANHIPPQDIKDFFIVPSYTHFSGSDRIESPAQYVSSKLLLKYRSGRGQKKQSRITFSGLAILIESQHVNSQIALKTDKGNWGNHLTNVGTGFHKIALVDPIFEKVFEVYGHDQIEARTVLNPSVMELFLRLNFLFSNWEQDFSKIEEKTRAAISNHNIEEIRHNLKSNLQANFMGSRVLLLIETPYQIFKPVSLFKSSFDMDLIRKTLYQIYLIDQIYNLLKKS